MTTPIAASEVEIDNSFLDAEVARINGEIGKKWGPTEAVRFVRLNTESGYDAAGVATFGTRLAAIFKQAGWAVSMQYQADRNVRQMAFSRPEPLLATPFTEAHK